MEPDLMSQGYADAWGDHQETGVGYLDWRQWQRFEWAVHNAVKLVPWLRVAGYVRGGEADVRVSSTSDRPLGLPPTWIAAEEISRLLNELNGWPELADAANDQWGAEVAIMLTREVETARAKWPYEDKPHSIRHMRCAGCHMLTLRYEPPRHDGDAIRVHCRDCGHQMDDDAFGLATALIEKEHSDRAEQERLGKRERSRRNGGTITANHLPVGISGPGANYPAT